MHKCELFLISVWLVFSLSPFTSAQETAPNLQFKTLSLDDGLSDSSVGIRGDAILRDHQGFIWIATHNGLNRYDGYSFRQVLATPGEPGLSDNFVFSIFEDRDNYIWVGTLNGLDRYNSETETFTHIDISQSEIEKASIKNIGQDKHGDIWAVSLRQGIFRFSSTGEFKKLYSNFGAQAGTIPLRQGVQSTNNSLLFPTSNGLIQYLPESDSFKQVLLHDGESGVNVLHPGQNGSFYAGSDKGLLVFNPDSNTFTDWKNANGETPFKQLEIRDIEEDKEGNLWLAYAGDGFIQFNPEQEIIHFISSNKEKKGALAISTIFDIYLDDANFLWFGTNLGAVYTSLNSQEFNFKPNTVETEEGASDKPVMSMLVTSEGETWVGSIAGGLTRTTAQGEKSHYYADENARHGLSGNTISALHEDKQGNIWLAVLKRGLLRYVRESDNFISYQSPPIIFNILDDQHGTIWIATKDKGVYYLKTGEQVALQYESPELSVRSVTSLHKDKHQQIWVGTVDGLFVIDPVTKEQTVFEANNTSNSIAHKVATTFYEDTKQNLMWIGTADGISRYDIETNTFTNYKKREGLLGNIITAIQEDSLGRIWIATNNGLNLFDKNNSKFLNFSENDGLRETDFSHNAYAKTDSGLFLFGSSTGYTEFNPLDIKTQQKAPRLLLTDFRVFNKTARVDPSAANGQFSIPQIISSLEILNLSYRERFFSFEFAAIDALKPRQINYSYMLEGWDKSWINTDFKNRIASYTNIPPGNYVLKARAQDSSGTWKTETQALNISISPPFWRTRFAHIFYIFTFIALILAIIKYRTKQLENRTKELNQAVITRTKEIEQQKKTIEGLMQKKEEIFESISHEFRTPLTLILGPLGQLLKDERNLDYVTQTVKPVISNGKKLLRMIDQILDLSRLEKAEDIHGRTNIEVSQFIREFIVYLDSAFKEKNLSIQYQPEDKVFISIAPASLEKIVGNLLSNAIKYSYQSGEIEIICKRSNEHAVISIEDHGPGIQKEDQERIFERFVRLEQHNEEIIPGTGIGLALVKQLTEANKGKIRVESQSGCGTAFVIEFPLTQSTEQEGSLQVSPSTELEISTARYSLRLENEVEASTNLNRESQPVPKLLIVEDHADMREFITVALGSAYEYYYAPDGSLGEEIALEVIPDFIITDLMMPKKDGFAFSQAIRNNEKTSHIPILMLTAKADAETRKLAWKTNIDEHIEKPFDPEELQARCQNLLSIRDMLSQKLATHIHSRNKEKLDFLSERDRSFIEKLKTCLTKNYHNPELGAQFMATALAMSESQLQRKIKALLNQSIPDYVRKYRLTVALDELKTGKNITDIAFNVGFSSNAYFSQCFKKEYGKSPKAMQDELR